jgi:recombination protein RecA
MARVKKNDPAFVKDIIKKYGNVISTGNQILEKRKDYKVISVSPSIDLSLSGGIKEGSWVILTGDPKCGKTTTALQIAANCQKEGRPIIYLDAEGRLKEMNLLGVDGLDKEKMQVIHSEDEPLSAEVFLDIAVKLVSAKENEGCVCIIDSTSSLMPAKELDGDMTPGRAGLPKILSVFCKKMGQIVPNQRATIIIITHFIANTSGYGASRMPDCGRKIQYQADTRMEVKSISPWVQADRQVGQAVNWKVVCSSMGSPGTECQSWIKYGHGIDKIQELIMLGLDLGLIGKAGAWFTCEFMVAHTDIVKEIKPEINIEDTEAVLKSVKFQGQEKLYNFFLSNDKVVNKLEKEIRLML